MNRSRLAIRRSAGAFLLALGTAAAVPAAAAAQAADPWAVLEGLRSSLEVSPAKGADFEQTFIPAGFTEGEQETGEVAFSLPACIRWDYDDPFPKSYLLCGHTAWTWNEGEDSGRRYLVGADEESGLDLLRLDVEELRERYKASAESAPEGRWRVRLVPLGKETPILDAELLIEADGRRMVALLYHDREGNLTRFTFGDYQPIANAGRFEPPAGLHWLTD